MAYLLHYQFLWHVRVELKNKEPSHEIMVLFILPKLILQIRMRSHPVGLDVWFFVGPFVNVLTSCMQTAKALARLRGCAGSPEPSLVAYVISTIISWASSIIIWTMKYSSDTKKSNKEVVYQQNDSMKLWSECVSCIFSDVHISEKSAFEYGLVNHALSSAMRTLVKVSTVMFLSFRTDKSEQTV